MNSPDIGQVEKKLTTIVEKERKEAIGYTLLIVLCTPFFVVLASMIGMFILLLIFGQSDYDYDLNASGIYTGVIIFLALMLSFVTSGSNTSEQPNEFDKTWLAGGVVFLILVIITYASSLKVQFPVAFGIIFSVLGFLILSLVGRVQMKKPVMDDSGEENVIYGFILVIAGFIAMAYGEVARGSWLWIPPDQDEIRIAAWILCKLETEKPEPLKRQSISEDCLSLLSRLKLIHVMQHEVKLTLKGSDLIEAAGI